MGYLVYEPAISLLGYPVHSILIVTLLYSQINTQELRQLFQNIGADVKNFFVNANLLL